MGESGLSQQIEVFNRLLPSLRRERGDVWAVVSATKLEGSFGTFDAAAKFAIEKLGEVKVLIRHTNARQPHIPFVALVA